MVVKATLLVMAEGGERETTGTGTGASKAESENGTELHLRLRGSGGVELGGRRGVRGGEGEGGLDGFDRKALFS